MREKFITKMSTGKILTILGAAGLATLIGIAIANSGGIDEPRNKWEFENEKLDMPKDTTLKSWDELLKILGDLYGPGYK